MPFEDKAPCGDPRSAFGTCCCTCVHLVETRRACGHQGGPGACYTGDRHPLMDLAESTEYGYACTVGMSLGGDGFIFTDWQKHGMCECYEERPSGRLKWEPRPCQ